MTWLYVIAAWVGLDVLFVLYRLYVTRPRKGVR